MCIAVFIVQHRPALDRFLRHFQRDVDGFVRFVRCALDCQLQCVQGIACIPSSHPDQVLESVPVELDIARAKAAFSILQ